MENKISYEDWRSKIFEILDNKENKREYTRFQIEHKLNKTDVYRNSELFEMLYNQDNSPFDALQLALTNYIDEFVRPLGEFTDMEIKEEFLQRDIDIDIDLYDIPTWQLEETLDYRYDSDYVSLHNISTRDLEEELINRKGISYKYYNNEEFKKDLAELLNLANHFSYSNDELIELVKSRLNKC